MTRDPDIQMHKMPSDRYYPDRWVQLSSERQLTLSEVAKSVELAYPGRDVQISNKPYQGRIGTRTLWYQDILVKEENDDRETV